MFKIDRATVERLRNSKICFSYKTTDRPWIDDAIILNVPEEAIYAEDYASFFVRTPFHTIGAFSYSWSPLPSFVTIGRYCSIAANVEVMPNAHPTELFTTSSMLYDAEIGHRVRFYADNAFDNDDCMVGAGHMSNGRPIEIGNDVYIATGVKIRAGVKIGDGAIVGAYSTVTKDVAPYSVVVGNPGRVVRMRYVESQVESLRKLKWWNWDFRTILAQSKTAPIDEFTGRLQALIEKGGVKSFEPNRNCIRHLLFNTGRP